MTKRYLLLICLACSALSCKVQLTPESIATGRVAGAGATACRDGPDLPDQPALGAEDRLVRRRGTLSPAADRADAIQRARTGACQAAFLIAPTTADELQAVVRGGELLPLLSSLVDAVSDRDHALLDDLERLIHEKREALEREGE